MNSGWKSKLMSGGTLLIGSIALNLFLAGVVGGAALRGPLFPPSEPERTRPVPFQRTPGSISQNRDGQDFNRPRDPGQMVERMARGLETADAEKLRAIFEETRKDIPAPRDEMQQSMQKISGILRQDKPDEAALQGVLDEIQKAGQSMHEGMAKSMKRIATEMSPAARVKIADAMEREGPRPDRGMTGRPSDFRERMMQRRQMEASPEERRPERPTPPAKPTKPEKAQ
jgi:uncharacterized membrane protein